jgi:hypothetical protein
MATTGQFYIIGVQRVMQNMNEELRKIEGRSVKGLILAQIHVHRQMETVPPKIPVDLGNLRHSYFATASKKGTVEGNPPSDVQGMINSTINPLLIFGFSANYALFVHENLEANFKRAGAGAKYMETHLNSQQNAMLEIIRQNAYIR